MLLNCSCLHFSPGSQAFQQHWQGMGEDNDAGARDPQRGAVLCRRWHPDAASASSLGAAGSLPEITDWVCVYNRHEKLRTTYKASFTPLCTWFLLEYGREFLFFLLGSNLYLADFIEVVARKPHSTHTSPEGRPGMSDVSPLSGISGLSFDSTLLSPLLFFCLVLLPFLSYRFLPAGPFF